MRIALLQSAGHMADVDSNLNELAQQADLAANSGAELLITPEMYTTGYNLESFEGLSQSSEGQIAKRVAQITTQTGVHILYGYCELYDGKQFNSAQLINRRGEALLNYRKQHLYGDIDRRWFAPGKGSEVVELDGIRIGVLICFDVEFPEAVRLLALQGAQLVAVPTSLMHPYQFVARHLIQARAYENQCYVAYTNRIGQEGELSYCGHSIVAGPDGEKISAAEYEAALLIADINPQFIDKVRAAVDYMGNRRPQLYQNLLTDRINYD